MVRSGSGRQADARHACCASRRRPASGPGSEGPDGVKRVLVEREQPARCDVLIDDVVQAHGGPHTGVIAGREHCDRPGPARRRQPARALATAERRKTSSPAMAWTVPSATGTSLTSRPCDPDRRQRRVIQDHVRAVSITPAGTLSASADQSLLGGADRAAPGWAAVPDQLHRDWCPERAAGSV